MSRYSRRARPAVPLDLADPVGVLLAAHRAFQGAGLETAAYGGLVVAMYGRPRETRDVDMAVSTATPEAAHEALTATGIMVVRASAGWVTSLIHA